MYHGNPLGPLLKVKLLVGPTCKIPGRLGNKAITDQMCHPKLPGMDSGIFLPSFAFYIWVKLGFLTEGLESRGKKELPKRYLLVEIARLRSL